MEINLSKRGGGRTAIWETTCCCPREAGRTEFLEQGKPDGYVLQKKERKGS